VDGFSSLKLKEQSEVISALYETDSLPGTLADFLGVTHVSKPGTLFLWNERSSALPMITIGQTPLFAEPADTLRKITSSDFDPRHTVYLPSSVTESTALGSPDAKILSQEVSAHRINLTVQSAHPAMVVIAQTFYPNWRAFVDGQPVPLWRANHAFQALQVPAGQHEVKIVYQDRAFAIGASLSAVTLLGCMTVLFRSRIAGKIIDPAVR
jgi:hypothetical protein